MGTDNSPVNTCKLCDGTGHILTADGPIHCQCWPEFKARVAAYSEEQRKERRRIAKKLTYKPNTTRYRDYPKHFRDYD